MLGISKFLFECLKLMQYKKRGGNYFGEKTLRDMLMNEHYIGTYLYTSKKTGKSLRIEKNHPAIIDEKTFLTAQARLAESTARTPKPRSNKNRTFYLTGKIKCGYCGDVNCTGPTGRWTYKGEIKRGIDPPLVFTSSPEG